MPVPKPRFVQLLNRAQRALQRWIEARPESWEGISAAQVGLLFVLQARKGEPAAVGEIAGLAGDLGVEDKDVARAEAEAGI